MPSSCRASPYLLNNLLDSNAALNCVLSLDSRRPACVIVKHETPCGVAQADTLLEAYQKALATDPTSAFGGIIAINCPLDVETAQAMLSQQFVEVLLIPQTKPEAFRNAANETTMAHIDIRFHIIHRLKVKPAFD